MEKTSNASQTNNRNETIAQTVSKHIMQNPKLLYLILIIILSSCSKEKKSVPTKEFKTKQIDTTKLYHRTKVIYEKDSLNYKEIEVYVSKENDTIVNQWKKIENGKIDSSQSKFYNLKLIGKKSDSILTGQISFYSPGDSIPDSKIYTRFVTFTFLQPEKDSLVFKEIKSDKNIIDFKYRIIDSLGFMGFISDLRATKIDSLPEQSLVNRNYFAVDTDIWTNNTFVEIVK
ncbi:hypothetical protein [uncultured Winogradskyella sp.]|uniref:hypothetical protein n=1 Tax=uncultured Winogradskyella sp. TaxID=395353 RepID=UPI0035162A45